MKNVILMLQSITLSIILQKKKNSRRKLPSFLCFFTRLALPLSVHGTLLLPLMLLMTTAKKTLFAGIHIHSRGIMGFTEQHAQKMILQSQDFNLRLIHEANNYLKN